MCNNNNGITNSVLELIGNTPLLALDRFYTGKGRILAKCEFLNPSGSLKDRSAFYMIEKAKKKNELKENQTVYEMTSGNQGIGLAMVCGVLNHPFKVSMSKGNSKQRVILMKILGADLNLINQITGKYGSVTEEDKLEVLKYGEKLIKENPDYYFVNQFENENNSLSHYETTGPEIWKQTCGKLDAFCMTVGTAGCFVGVSKFLKEKNPAIKCFVVEPEGCEPIAGKKITKPLHLFQGSGYGDIPHLFNYKYLDECISVSEEEVLETLKLAGIKEGIFIGYTAAGNLAAALKLKKSNKLKEDAIIVTILCDHGLKY